MKVFDHEVLFHRLPYHRKLSFFTTSVRSRFFKAMIGNSCAAAKSALIRQREIGP
jgi:hypothetical protein